MPKIIDVPNQGRVEFPDEMSDTDIVAAIKKNALSYPAPAKSKPFGQQLNDTIADVPRQLGLTARYGLEGVGGMANMLTSPIRAGLNAVLPKRGGGIAGQITGQKPQDAIGEMNFSGMADGLGLPSPRTSGERVVGDATRMVAGGLVPIGAGAALGRAGSSVARGVGGMMAANPGAQLASAGAAGAAGGYTRETGGNEGSQIAASLAAGIATPFAMNGVMRAGRAAQSLRTPPAPNPIQIDVTINNAIESSGMNLSQLPDDVARGIRADVAKAMQIGGNLDANAIRRLADYRLTGAMPNRAGLTLDPAIVTQQRNLAKLGINSKDEAAQQLGQMQNANNRQMTTGLNNLGAGTADDAIAGGSKIMGALEQRNTRAKELIGKRYDAARAADGRSAALDPQAFTSKANNLLDDALLGGKLPADVRNLLNKTAKGEMPLTVDVAEQFKTRIGELQRSTIDMAERKALGLVRGALDEAPLLPGQQIGQEALDAFGKARSLNRKWMSIVERTPALQAVRDGIEPDKFVQQFVIGGGPKSNVMDVAMLKSSIKGSPDAMDSVRTQITSFLKQKALNGADDEVGNFSQSGYNKALSAIGERKLKLFFTPEDINQMKAIGRVSSYEQFQPAGSAINNSNTAAAGLSAILDRIGGSAMLSKIPLGNFIQQPLQNVAIGMGAKQAMNAPRALTDGVRQPLLNAPRGLAMSPAALMGTEGEETRRKRAAGLLLP